jgi:hypothetical protein
MTTLNKEIYEAFQATGIDDAKAKAAAASIYDKEQIATKLDIAELKAEIQAMLNRQLLTLTVIILGSMSILTGIFIAVVKRL